MRTRTERIEARGDVMHGANDHDVTLCQAVLELCQTIDDAAERLADASDELRKSIDQLNDDLRQSIRHAVSA
jgi:methyl-accepting chemotaxis protein